jgi:outer membrane protein assembly factor BamB
MKQITSLLLVLLTVGIGANAQILEKIWSSSPEFITPESALYDEGLDVVFVSNIGHERDSKVGDGFISQMNLDGEILNLKWLSGLNAPKGMAIWNGKLYVSDMDELVVINIETASIVERYPAPNAKFLNDVSVCKNGIVFVSDMHDRRIYALQNNRFESWLQHPDLENVNGLWAEEGKLYAGNNSVWKIDIATKEMKEQFGETKGIDGLEKLENGNFIFSNWAGRIHVSDMGNVVTLLDTTEESRNTADIDFVPGKNIVLVPTFLGNNVDAYKLIW